MKTKLIKILFQLVSFLADKTHGFSMFSKWKIALGSLLVGVSIVAGSCRKPTESNVSCYSPIPPKDTTEQITCYDPMPIDTNITQAINK